MLQINKILYPCDLTENSPKIIKYVLSFAEKYESEIHILHVVRDLLQWGELYVPYFSLEFDQKRILESGREALNRICDNHFKTSTRYTKEVVSGDAAAMILEIIASRKIDMVIMGTHGRKGLEHTIFGSVAEVVVKRSPVPVMTINPCRAA